MKELRYATRSLLKRPGFAAVAVLTLALGIGANTAIFSVVNATLLRPLPFKDPERVVMIWGFMPKLAHTTDKLPNSSANFLNLKAKSESFERLAAFRSWSWQLTGGGEPELLRGVRVSADFFEAVGVGPTLGRAFTAQDKRDAPGVIIVNDILAARAWPGEDPIGKRLRVGFEREQREVVGVVGSIKQAALDAAARPAMYVPHLQFPTSGLTVLVRTRAEPMSMAAAVRQEVRAIDKDVPVTQVQTMDKVLGASVAQPRFSMLLVGLFAALALVLSAVGIYGAMAYSVSRRAHEIGVRMALGAGAGQVLKLVLKDGMMLALAGIAIGLLGAFALTRLMASLLFGVGAKDPLTFVSVAIFLAVVALIACYLPARRATKIDPLVALRNE